MWNKVIMITKMYNIHVDVSNDNDSLKTSQPILIIITKDGMEVF